MQGDASPGLEGLSLVLVMKVANTPLPGLGNASPDSMLSHAVFLRIGSQGCRISGVGGTFGLGLFVGARDVGRCRCWVAQTLLRLWISVPVVAWTKSRSGMPYVIALPAPRLGLMRFMDSPCRRGVAMNAWIFYLTGIAGPWICFIGRFSLQGIAWLSV